MQDIFDEEEQQWEEEWQIILSTKGEYKLSKLQALILKQAMAEGKKQVMFETFMIPPPFVVEFYRINRFKKGLKQLEVTVTEKEYKPIPSEKWESIKEKIYEKIGKPLPKTRISNIEKDKRKEELLKQAKNLKKKT